MYVNVNTFKEKQEEILKISFYVVSVASVRINK